MYLPRKDNAVTTPPGFTMLELVVAMAIGAVVITMGVLTFQNFSAGTRPSGNYVKLTLGSTVMQNFYGLNQATIEVWVAPNYGQRAKADTLRDLLWDDVGKANAVFCLGRSTGVSNTIHPTSFTVPSTFQGQNMDVADDFRVQLESSLPSAVGIFTAYRGKCTSRNLSIFILQPSADSVTLSVRAVYDVDLISAVSTDGISGTYVSVRRYTQGTLTDFYDIFYPTWSGGAAFNPLAVAFERSARLTVVEGASIDRLKIAAARPFYFVWWPDPAVKTLEVATRTYDAADPRASYPNMGGSTSLFTIPMFPAL